MLDEVERDVEQHELEGQLGWNRRMDVDQVLVAGNGMCDHDHPIPR